MASIATSPIVLTSQKPLIDPLAYLPCSTIVEYRKGQPIYADQPTVLHIYLLMAGRVKVSRLTDDGRQVVIDIYQPDEFFGEAAFLMERPGSERATALESTRVMKWPFADIESLIAKRPQLGIAFLQIMTQRTTDFSRRIESLSVDSIARRLAWTLLRFAGRMGVAENDGSVRLMPFTHDLLAQYVGTSREIVTHYMIEFRRQGYLVYSRQGITVYCPALKEWLRQNPRCSAVEFGADRKLA